MSDFPEAELANAIGQRGVAKWLAGLGVEVVHAGLFDTSGTLREKRLSLEAAARALQGGWSFIDAIQWWTADDATWRTGGSEQQPARVDLSSGRHYPFDPAAAMFVADFAGPLADLSPRVQLVRIVERARAALLEAEVGWEFECIVLEGRPAGDQLVPAMESNWCWSALTPSVQAEVLSGLVEVLDSGEVPVDHVCAELGPGCLEIATKHRKAVRAADDAAFTKLWTKAFFARRSQTATFMAQLGETFPGLGGHPSMSLRATADGRLLLAEPDGTLSKLAGSAIAGIVALLPELLVMLAPNPNSYRRFAPGNWAARTATWGIGNYSCGLRVVTGDASSTRLELRVPGADVDPHLATAMLLAAATWGVEGGLEPPEPINAPADGRLAGRTRPMPRNLTEAVDRFRASPAAIDLFGSRFVEHYADSRLAEEEACRRFVPSGERHRYLSQV